MAVGLAVLTAYGSTTIDRLSAQVYAPPTPTSRSSHRSSRPAVPLNDGLVVDALERWAAGEAARIMVGLFLVAAVVVIAAARPGARARGRRARMLAARPAGRAHRRRGRRRSSRRRTPSDRWRRHASRPSPSERRPDQPGDSPCAAITRRSARTRCHPGRAARAGSTESEAIGLDAIPRPLPPDGVVWIDVSGPVVRPGRARSRELLGLHPLIAEDILEGNQRAKIEVDRRPHPHRHVRARLRRPIVAERDRHRPRDAASC